MRVGGVGRSTGCMGLLLRVHSMQSTQYQIQLIVKAYSLMCAHSKE